MGWSPEIRGRYVDPELSCMYIFFSNPFLLIHKSTIISCNLVIIMFCKYINIVLFDWFISLILCFDSSSIWSLVHDSPWPKLHLPSYKLRNTATISSDIVRAWGRITVMLCGFQCTLGPIRTRSSSTRWILLTIGNTWCMDGCMDLMNGWDLSYTISPFVHLALMSQHATLVA